ncbi:MAG: hypothetical protein AABZ36_06435, partial [Nitrospirota bacterium]
MRNIYLENPPSSLVAFGAAKGGILIAMLFEVRYQNKFVAHPQYVNLLTNKDILDYYLCLPVGRQVLTVFIEEESDEN